MKTKLIPLAVLASIIAIAPATVSATELISEGGFEVVGSPWFTTNATRGWWNINLPSGAHSGNRYVYIGRESDGTTTANNVEDILYQTVTIPAGTTSSTLTFWLKITSNDTSGTAHDTLAVEIRSTGNSLLQTLANYSNVDAPTTGTWTQKTLNISGYANQTVRISFHGKTDASIETVFRIDDVSLQTAGSCTYSLSPTSASHVSGCGAGSFSVTAGSGCAWSATANQSWIHTTSSGSGNGTVNYTFDGNTSTSSRSGTIAVQGQTFTITQAGLLAAPSLSGPADGAVGVSTTPTSSWSSVSGANRYWLTVSTSAGDLPTDSCAVSCPNCVSVGLSGLTDLTSYTPPAAFPYGGTTRTLSPNTTYYWQVQSYNTSGAQGAYSSMRSFTTASSCTYSLSPTSASHVSGCGSGSFSVTAGSGCAWSATANQSWIHTTSSGSGNSTVNYTFDGNTSTSSRSGTITVQGQTFTITQSGLLAAPSLSGPADGATGVSTTPTFSWSSVSGANRYWLTVSTSAGDLPTDPCAVSCANCVSVGLSGLTDLTSYAPPTAFPYGGTTRTLSPNTTYYWQVQSYNTSGNQGQFSSPVRSFTTAASCTYSLSATSASHNSGCSSGSFGVTAGSGCSWSASTSYGWIHTTSSGSGNGTVNYSIDGNTTTSSRTGTITVQGQTFTITQAGLLPAPSLSGPANGATGVSTTPAFGWSSVAGATRYWLMLSTSPSDLPTDPCATSCPNCVSVGLSGITDLTSYTPPASFPYGGTTRTLSPNTAYYWQVQGWNNTSGDQGQYSSVRSFTTAGTLLPAPTLSGPANGATGISTTPTFSWSSVAGANRYWLMLSTSPSDLPTDPYATSCSGCVATGVSGNTASTSHTLPANFPYGGTSRTLNPNTTYYWQVQSYNTDGTQGNYSSVRSFTTSGGTPMLSVIPANPPTQPAAAGSINVNVNNTGGGTMNYSATVTSGNAWLHITSGASGGNSGTIVVSYDANAGGQRSGTIVVTATGATGSPTTITIVQASPGQQHLTGFKIGVDPGHGGSSTGAVGPNYGLTEKSVNLATALALKKYLEAEGATVIITRTTDVDVSLTDRTDLFVNNAVNLAISVHHNGGGTLNTTMVFIYCDTSLATRGALASNVVQRLASSTGIGASQSPASTVDTLCGGHSDWLTGITGVGQANLHMVREPENRANIPSILAEVSFITNPAEEAKLQDADYLDKNGWAIYAGVADYLGFSPVPRTAPVLTGVGGSGLQPPSDGQFQIQIIAPTMQQVTVQACDDLNNWTDHSTLPLINGQCIFVDPNAGDHTQRYYRLKP